MLLQKGVVPADVKNRTFGEGRTIREIWFYIFKHKCTDRPYVKISTTVFSPNLKQKQNWLI